MDILIATPNVLVGDGQGRVNFELASCLARKGHRVTLLADRVEKELCGRDGVEWRRLPSQTRLPALPREILWSRKATAWLSRNGGRYDIVHLNGASAFVPHHVNTCHFVHGSFRRQLASEARPPGLRSRYHRVYTNVNCRAERRAYALAQRVVAVSGKTAGELDRFVGVPRERLKVIYNGIDVSVFRPNPEARAHIRHELEIASETFALLFVGEFVVPRKGLRTVLKAMHGLPETVHLFVVGTGSPSAYGDALAGIEERVRFLGFRHDVPDLYAAMDCFAYPTRYEPFGLVVLEALAAGVPVITTRESGSGELIEHGRDGILLQGADDVEGLRRSIVGLQRDRTLAVELARHGRILAKTNTWACMSDQYEFLYREVLRTTRGSLETISPGHASLSPRGPRSR